MSGTEWTVGEESTSMAKVVVVKDGAEHVHEFESSMQLRDVVNEAASKAGLSSVIVKVSREGSPIDSNRGADTLAALGGTIFVFAKASGAQ